MKFSSGARLAIAALLALSIGSKALFSRPAPAIRDLQLSADGAALLAAAGFVTSVETRPFGNIVHARRGPCRLMLAEYSSYGTMAVPLAALAAPIGRLRFAWRGVVHETAPKLLPLVDFYVRRELRRAGFHPAHRPIIAFAAGRRCPAAPVDWGRLAAFPG